MTAFGFGDRPIQLVARPGYPPATVARERIGVGRVHQMLLDALAGDVQKDMETPWGKALCGDVGQVNGSGSSVLPAFGTSQTSSMPVRLRPGLAPGMPAGVSSYDVFSVAHGGQVRLSHRSLASARLPTAGRSGRCPARQSAEAASAQQVFMLAHQGLVLNGFALDDADGVGRTAGGHNPWSDRALTLQSMTRSCGRHRPACSVRRSSPSPGDSGSRHDDGPYQRSDSQVQMGQVDRVSGRVSSYRFDNDSCSLQAHLGSFAGDVLGKSVSIIR